MQKNSCPLPPFQTPCNLGIASDRLPQSEIENVEEGSRDDPLYPGPGSTRKSGTDRLVGGDRDGSLADFDRALEADPDYPEAYNNRGVARHGLGDLAGALADFDRALEVAPGYVEAYNNRGTVRHALGDYLGAVADFDRALEIDRRRAEAYSNRAPPGTRWRTCGVRSPTSIGPSNSARATPRPTTTGVRRGRRWATWQGPSPISTGRCNWSPGRPPPRSARTEPRRHALGDYPGAVADYDDALRLTPQRAAAPLYHGRGGARHAAGDLAGAIADYDRALELDPGLCAAYISRGHARYHRRDPLGISDYRIAFRLDAGLAATEIIRALIEDLRRDPDAALENGRKHIRINPDDLVAYARRGLTLLLQGRDVEAEEDFQQVLTRGPEWGGPLGLLIDEATYRRGS